MTAQLNLASSVGSNPLRDRRFDGIASGSAWNDFWTSSDGVRLFAWGNRKTHCRPGAISYPTIVPTPRINLMVMIETSSGLTSIVTPCVELRFSWSGDHWEHAMISGGGCESIPRIWSVEMVSTVGDTARCSGPIYEHMEARVDEAGIARATLDGQDVSQRFSASFSVEEKKAEVVIKIEVTDLSIDPIALLDATFLIESSSGILDSNQVATITWNNPTSRLIIEAERPATIETHEEELGTIRCRAIAACEPSPETVSLRYRWRWIMQPTKQIRNREA